MTEPGDMVTLPRAELDELRRRLHALGKQKADLQVVVDWLSRIEPDADLERIIDAVFDALINTVGGEDIVLYFRISGCWKVKDLSGALREVDTIEDELALAAMAKRQTVEGERSTIDLLPGIALSRSKCSWALPLVAGRECVGVLKHVGVMTDFGDQLKWELQLFVNQLALHLERSIRSEGLVMKANQELERANRELEQANAQLRREVEERHRAWKRAGDLERQLWHLQKIEALGTLAGGVAHDFNNVLAAIIASAGLALQDLAPEHPAHESVLRLLQAARRGADHTRQILAYTRRTDVERAPVDVGEIVLEVLDLLRASVPAFVSLRADLPEESSSVTGDASQIHQVLFNLCTNAVHAIGQNPGEVVVAVDQVQLTERLAHVHGTADAGPFVRVVVRDNGPGIPDQVRARMFDPYFTTKGQDQGSGIGLAIVDGIVRDHGGFLQVRSQEGEGATFTIFLPPAPMAKRTLAAESSSTGGGTGRVLLVDDDEIVGWATQRFLQRAGYEVELCSSPCIALEQFREDVTRFDILVTDQAMPEMPGMELARRMRRLVPIPVVLCSGMLTEQDHADAAAIGISALLCKPFDPHTLTSAIRAAMKLA